MTIRGLERFCAWRRRPVRRHAGTQSPSTDNDPRNRQTCGVTSAVRWGTGVVMLGVSLGVAVLACGTVSAPSAADRRQPEERQGADGNHADPAGQPDLSAAVEGLTGRYGIAVVAVGSDRVASAGNWSSGWAWSTIKVPISVAAVRDEDGAPSPSTTGLLRQAVTMSDNDAAGALYRRLGNGSSSSSSAAVQAVLRDAGDDATLVQPAWSGTTVWSLTDQAIFAAGLPCIEGSAPVLDLMGQITIDHRWGLGELGSGARFKGGWGQNASGKYLVRQLGVVTLPNGDAVGVALASEPIDGSFETATADLSRMARWLSTQLGALSGGRC